MRWLPPARSSRIRNGRGLGLPGALTAAQAVEDALESANAIGHEHISPLYQIGSRAD